MTFYHSFQQQSIAINSLMNTTGSLSIERASLIHGPIILLGDHCSLTLFDESKSLFWSFFSLLLRLMI